MKSRQQRLKRRAVTLELSPPSAVRGRHLHQRDRVTQRRPVRALRPVVTAAGVLCSSCASGFLRLTKHNN
ncbi:hypothetical protein PR202_gb11496 [Eleusine coracana subsp. coracana]|uniref:Uncharacterized protein n=1 Tax=Eleusine coracana subsp. coracana TaxID=191504 RepID=A0AAV5EN46_ELECO|nr:hypothetical protein PR202_gb11496 [Eleusine coracana subsp. coracana]